MLSAVVFKIKSIASKNHEREFKSLLVFCGNVLTDELKPLQEDQWRSGIKRQVLSLKESCTTG